MNIKEKPINYKNDLPFESELCRITATVPHYHAHDLELIFCLEGEITLVAGHQNVTIHAGEIFSVDFRDIHYLHSETDNLVLLFHLDLRKLDMDWDYLQYVFFACESSHCYPYQKKAMEKVIEIILSLSYALHNSDTAIYDAGSYVKAANELLHLLFKYFNWFNYENRSEQMNIDLYNRFYRTLAYCNENYMHKISVSQLASMEHVNRNYFSQFISKTVFTSFSMMIKYIRCYESEQLLLKTDMPIAEISFACGFSDPKYFYSAFRIWWGRTPTEHRNHYKSYMETDFHTEAIAGDAAKALIEKHIAGWMLDKTLE